METVLHAIAGYFFLLLTIRVLARRPEAQMTLYEFVIVFFMGGIIILSTVQRDRSVTNCTCAILTIGLVHRSLAMAKARWPALSKVIDGTPLILMKDGEWQHEVMKRMKVNEEDVTMAARGKGLPTLRRVKYAVLERHGEITILRDERNRK